MENSDILAEIALNLSIKDYASLIFLSKGILKSLVGVDRDVNYWKRKSFKYFPFNVSDYNNSANVLIDWRNIYYNMETIGLTKTFSSIL